MVVKIVNPETKEIFEYHLSPRLIKYLDNKVRPSLEKRDKDYVLLIDGYEGCLTGDTLIQTSRGKLSRRYTLKRLYNHFNKNPDEIIQKNKLFNLSTPTFVRSFNGKDIRLHKIKNVTYSGKKEVFLLKLNNGKFIKATETHKFLTREGWKPLKEIQKDEEIMCDKLHAKKNGRKKIKLYDIQLPVDYHPYSSVAGRVEVHKLIYEANMNGLEFTKFLDILLNEPETSKNLTYINPKLYSIHHKDGCHYNNSIDNLELIKPEDHLKYHSNNSYTNFSQGVPIFSKVEIIERKGIEDVYDIECEEPHHNFVANGIVVHNSGKSTWALQVGRYIDPSLSLDRICLTADEFKEAIRKANKNQCVIYDEAVTGLSASASITRVGRVLKSMMMQMRQKNLFVMVILPIIFEFNKYAVLSRARSFFHIYESRGRRGFWVGYNKRDLRKLYLKGKRTHSYLVKSRFYGRFYGKWAINEDLYRKKKEKALFQAEEEEELDKEGRISRERKVFLINWYLYMKKHEKMTQDGFINLLSEVDVKFTRQNISNVWKDIRKQGLIVKSNLK